MADLEDLKITKAKFPRVEVQARVDKLTNLIETEAPKWKLETALDELVATIKEKKIESVQISKTALLKYFTRIEQVPW